jgi:uncharacterized protein YihD (DUF1040 family)
MLKQLEQIWEEIPDLRLCQLIADIAALEGKYGDLFFIEDEIIEQAMSRWRDVYKG